MKYEYMLKCWGGFFNDYNIKYHGIEKFKYKWFDTKEERDLEVKYLKTKVKETEDHLRSKGYVNDSVLVFSLQEGYLTRYNQVISALVKDKGKIFEVRNELGYGFWSDDELSDLDIAHYFKHWKYDICADLTDEHELLFSTLLLEK